MGNINENLRPKACVLKTDGINCDAETKDAFNLAGAESRIVHVNQLRSGEENLKNYHILSLPGGFSYGDDVASGKILAIELNAYLADQINDMVHGRKGLVLGICNGNQVLVREGLLPFGEIGKMEVTLTNNNSGHFDCRPVNLSINKGHGFKPLKDWESAISYQVAHGEGKYFASQKIMENIEGENLVVFRYCDILGNSTNEYPANPNGSLNAIAGICDPSGRILGLMPHPERSVRKTQYPNWRRLENKDLEPQGLPLFQKMVEYVRQM